MRHLPPLNLPPSAETVDEIIRLYYEVYVPGLTAFFESRWYDFARDQQSGVKNPSSILRDNKHALDLFSSFLKTVTNIKTTDPADMVHSGHLETCVVWALARLPCVSVPGGVNQSLSPIPRDDDAPETRNRLLVFEALLSGDTLPSNPLTPPHPSLSSIADVDPSTQARVNELEFWYHLAQYIRQSHSSASPIDITTREQCLACMRSVLDGRENRDVLYSIAILREYTQQFDAAMNEQTVPQHLDEMDPRSKLAVATRFIRDEAASTGGTTNVVRRFADLAYRAFVRPGVNVNASGRRGG